MQIFSLNIPKSVRVCNRSLSSRLATTTFWGKASYEFNYLEERCRKCSRKVTFVVRNQSGSISVHASWPGWMSMNRRLVHSNCTRNKDTATSGRSSGERCFSLLNFVNYILSNQPDIKSGGVHTLIALHHGRETKSKSFASCRGLVNISGGSKIAWINMECNGDSLSVAVPSKFKKCLRACATPVIFPWQIRY